MRTPFMCANWKMHKTVEEAVEMAKEFKELVADVDDVEAGICAPAIDLYPLNEVLADTNVKLGSENMYYKESGAYTGELSPAMIKSVGCEYAIIGHSERREIFGEDDQLLNLKLKTAFANDIKPILCIGEKLAEREAGEHFARVKFQLEADLSGIEAEDVKDMVLAYEPLWAIGTGESATPEQAEEIIKFIRETVAKMYDEETAEAIRIQYGGSVKPWNVEEIMAQPNIDGALVGSASLEAESFSKIVKFK
ncbi:triosephosphate isomerase [Halobacteroides halobius DSM 5150]|uniref:Triosephosphate isomerase n=1 Tax=Halobacteroides halobius (strain ATCC 35273 / DSM 5150 / MD-1) TaxID=748449 RepID=L0K9L8_HALHC|nr:triose-phosphate isomerase [Halobacteroides halobius]AGB41992.1 triosephosphate isomerase [Halobacteroides halobius DSM 5150]